MARGWESKSIESQIESAQEAPARAKRQRLTISQVEALRNKESLELSRTRIQNLIESSENPRYRTMLQKQLADLEEKIARLA
jgi:hypothetical protein